jgi:hypothetical protein
MFPFVLFCVNLDPSTPKLSSPDPGSIKKTSLNCEKSAALLLTATVALFVLSARMTHKTVLEVSNHPLPMLLNPNLHVRPSESRK